MKTDPLTADDITTDHEFQVGQRYNREGLHDVFGGQRYSGIATPSKYPHIFLFTGDEGEEYGYEDEFLEDGSFLYTGEGQEGDMQWKGGNKAIRDHKKNGEALHLFENRDEAWIVTYVGGYELAGVRESQLSDGNDDQRRAFRFKLEPVGGDTIETDESPTQMGMDDLYERAKASSPTSVKTSKRGSKSYPRSEVVKEYARQRADGICQGCGEEAPFRDKSGNPFLEVHHLYRRADGGADDPDNVVALCPNCHQRIHNGQDGDEFNASLINGK